MKRFFALLLVSTLAFAFSSKAQTLKQGVMPSGTQIQIDDGLTSGEIDDLTNQNGATTYSSFGTITGTSLPTLAPSGCNGTKYACDLFVLIPSGSSATDAEIFTGLKNYLTANGWKGCGTAFSFTITPAGGSSFTATAKWFCKP